MKPKAPGHNLWTCPTCGRQFERKGQSHSCRVYPLEKHFEHKPVGRVLYEVLRKAVKRRVGAFKIESLECCIHFVSTSTFVAVKIFKSKIQVDFSLADRIKGKRLKLAVQMSAHRYLYYVDIIREDEIDAELMGWIQMAYDIKKYKVSTL